MCRRVGGGLAPNSVREPTKFDNLIHKSYSAKPAEYNSWIRLLIWFFSRFGFVWSGLWFLVSGGFCLRFPVSGFWFPVVEFGFLVYGFRWFPHRNPNKKAMPLSTAFRLFWHPTPWGSTPVGFHTSSFQNMRLHTCGSEPLGQHLFVSAP